MIALIAFFDGRPRAPGLDYGFEKNPSPPKYLEAMDLG
jgi:hypothetical protein